jgi:hypothetical protein
MSHTTRTALLVALGTALAAAQSPLRTPFNGQPLGGSGGNIYFDITVNTTITVTGLELNINQTANAVGAIDVWTCPGTFAGHETSQAFWTRVSGGTGTSRGLGVPTPIGIAPFVLTPGTYGMAFQTSGFFAHAYTAGTGANQTIANAEVSVHCGDSSNFPFAVLNPGPWVVNMNLSYSLGEHYGHGCYDSFRSVYESFTGAFDLGGSATATNSMRLVFTGTSYVLTSGSNAFFTPTSPNLHDQTTVTLTLPFALPYPGGTTTHVGMDYRGVLSPTPGNSYLTRPEVQAMLSGQPRWMPCWRDINPFFGSTNFDVDPSGSTAYCSWIAVPNFQGAIPNTFQVAFFANGDVEYRWQGMDPGGDTLVGWSPGLGALDPGSRDLSASLPLATQAVDRRATTIELMARPAIGSAPGFVLGSFPAGTAVAAAVLSFLRRDPGLDLAPLGMPGCAQYVGLDASLLLPITGGNAALALPLPNDATLVGRDLFAQGAAFAPAANALGVAASAGLRITIVR